MKAITPEAVFEEVVLNWGSKHADSKLSDLWEHDRSYLLWAANLGKSPCYWPPTPDIVARIKIAYLFAQGHAEEGERLFAEFQRWSAISMRGEGLSELPRPGREKCAEIISRCNLLAGHSDLDGIYSVVIAMKLGGALEGGKMKGAFGSLKLLRYGHKSLEDYTQALAVDEEDTTVIIDFAAHPAAALTLRPPHYCAAVLGAGFSDATGIYEPSMPSCPRLLATFCGLSVSEEILSGCDRVDGAIYKNVEETIDLSNPFVALEAALSLMSAALLLKRWFIWLRTTSIPARS